MVIYSHWSLDLNHILSAVGEYWTVINLQTTNEHNFVLYFEAISEHRRKKRVGQKVRQCAIIIDQSVLVDLIEPTVGFLAEPTKQIE